MGMMLSIRTPETLYEALGERARSQGKSMSEFVREILENAMVERSVLERTRHLVGRLDFEVDGDEWRQKIRERNWRR
jgi:metal-responsive CopG/Arc/MetJ family transcriptional regulator